MAASDTSPTLSLKLRSAEVLGGFQALRREVEALKASLAGLRTTGGATGTKRLEAEVKELRAALAATRLEMENMVKAREAAAVRTVAATQREVAAERAKTQAVKAAALDEKKTTEEAEAYRRRVMLRSAEMTGALAMKEHAAREKAAAAERVLLAKQAAAREAVLLKEQAAVEKAAAHKLALQLESAKMTAKLAIDANRAVEASLAQHLAVQERMRDAALDREFAQLRAAHARNERLNEQARARNLRDQEREARAAARAAGAGGAAGAVVAAGAQSRLAGVGRSAARGAAAASGSLFLTYGQSIPALATTFGTGVAVRESIQRGSQFQYQTAFAGALGQMNPEQIARMRTEILKLGTDSIYGPIELAEAMRVLQQTGIEAAEALAILPVSMKVALQGETDLTKASESLVGVMRQYKLEVKDIPAIGDAMSKTAAVTQANISSLMEALKAAVGVEQYGVDLNQALANIGLLAKQGITGSSAGTFFRRFAEDLYMPKSDDARRAMREIGFKPFNADGTRKPFREVQEDFVTRLKGYNPESQIKLLGSMMDIRGLKDANVLIRDMSGEFEKLRGLIDDSKGSLDLFWNALSGETRSEWLKAKNNLEKSLIEAFQKVEPQINEFTKLLRDAFSSDMLEGFFTLAIRGFVQLAEQARPVLTLLARLDKAQGQTLGGAVKEGAAFALEAAANPMNPLARNPAAQLALRAAAAKLRQSNDNTPVEASGSAAVTGSLPMEMILAGLEFPPISESVLGRGAPMPKPKQASDRVLDKLKFQEQQRLADALEREAMASMRRRRAEIEQDATFAQRLADEKYRGGLMAEEAYVQEIDRLNEQRAQSAIEAANEEMQILHDTQQVQATEAEKFATQTRIKDLQAQRDRLLDEARFQKEMTRVRREGAANLAEIETRKIIRKHGEEGEEFVAGLQENLRGNLLPEALAARYAVELQTRKKFLAELRDVDAEIEKKGVEGNTGEIGALKERKRLLEETLGVQVKIRGEAAQMAKEMERSYEYGRDSLFVEWADAATNSARQAREAWGTALTGTAQELTRFITTGKGQFRDLAATILEMLVRIQIERQLAGIVNAFTGLGSIGAGGGSGGSAGAGDVFGVTSVAQAHTGGIVGMLARSRSVNPLLFSGAPRFHSGGVVGDEMPIIARKGEGVFTESQMRKMAPAGGNVTVKVINESGVPVEATASTHFDGEEMVVDLFLRRLGRDAGAREQVRQAVMPPQH